MATATAPETKKTVETSFMETCHIDGRMVGDHSHYVMMEPGVFCDMTSRIPPAPEGYKVDSVRVLSTLVTTFVPSVPVLNEALVGFIEALLDVLKLSGAGTSLKTISDREAHVLDADGNEILAVRRITARSSFNVQFYRPGTKKCDSKCKVTDDFGIERPKLGCRYAIYSIADAALDARLTEDKKIMCKSLRIYQWGEVFETDHGRSEEIDLADKIGTLECPDKEWCLPYFCNEHHHGRPSDVEEAGRVTKKARVF